MRCNHLPKIDRLATRQPPSRVYTDARGVHCEWCAYPCSAGCLACYEARKAWEESRKKDQT